MMLKRKSNENHFSAETERPGSILTCPWCGTSEVETRTNCKNCGGPLPPRSADYDSAPDEMPAEPPPPPREISENYVRQLMFANAWTITSIIFSAVGAIFAFVGLILTILLITAFIGIPFLGIGTALTVFGVMNLNKQHKKAKNTVEVLRRGSAAEGVITEVEQDYSVSVNKRYPYCIKYNYTVEGQSYEGSATTFKDPSHNYWRGKKTWVLYLPEKPAQNSLYPHP